MNYNNFKKSIDRNSKLLNEGTLEGAGRGRSIQPAAVIRSGWKDLIKTINYDFLNRSTHHLPGRIEKFNFNNYYSLDIRLDINNMVDAFLGHKGTFIGAFNGVYNSKLERTMVSQLKNAYRGSMADFQAKDILKQHYKDQYPDDTRFDDERSSNDISEKLRLGDGDERFDDFSSDLLGEKLSPEDIELGNATIKANKLKKGSELTYNTAKGNDLEVTVAGLPVEFGGKADHGYISVRSYDGSKTFRVAVVRDGKTKFNLEIPKRTPKDSKESEDYENPDNTFWDKGLLEILEDPKIGAVMTRVYDDLPIITVYTGGGGEDLAIKRDITVLGKPKDGFVSLIMDGLSSAVRGHKPQGVTLEEIMSGTFSIKAISPDQGTFINRVKDPTSNKEFSFRSDMPSTLKELHGIILDTFKNSNELNIVLPSLKEKLAGDVKLKDLLLYMTQDDFNRLEKGGKGFKGLLKGLYSELERGAHVPDV